MLGFVKRKMRRKLLMQGRVQGKPVFPAAGSLRSVGVLYKLEGVDDLEKFKALVALLKGMGISYGGFVVDAGKCFKDKLSGKAYASDLGEGVVVIGKEDMNWIGIPKQEVVRPFLSRKYNLAVVMDGNSDFTLEYILGKMEADFTVSMGDMSHIRCNMVLAPAENDIAPVEYIKQLFKYLEDMNRISTH